MLFQVLCTLPGKDVWDMTDGTFHDPLPLDQARYVVKRHKEMRRNKGLPAASYTIKPAPDLVEVVLQLWPDSLAITVPSVKNGGLFPITSMTHVNELLAALNPEDRDTVMDGVPCTVVLPTSLVADAIGVRGIDKMLAADSHTAALAR